MKITRYTQSCILIEESDTKILIDPGDGLQMLDTLPENLKHVDAILYTHQHADHYDETIHTVLIENNQTAVYANASHSEIIGNVTGVVRDGDRLSINGIDVRVVAIDHCLLPDGSSGPENVGYIVNSLFFHPGDGKMIDTEKVPIIALPITGPDISMKDAFAFGQQVGAKIAIPIHYDKIGAYPHVYKAFAERFPFDFSIKVLGVGESLDTVSLV